MRKKWLNVANGITTFRIALVLFVAFLLYNKSLGVQVLAFFLTIFVILLDWFDGFVARLLSHATKAGSLYDIVGDRIVENVLWIAFAHLNWVPVWVPITFITRSFLVDFVRTLAFKHGKTPFGKATMIKSSIGRFVTSSKFMRGLYGVLKSVVFAFVIAANNIGAVLSYFALSRFDWLVPVFSKTTYILVVLTVVVCVLRAVPPILEAREFLEK